jgi:hypothetical protein
MGQKLDFSFFDENEQRVNKIVSKLFYFGNLTGPAMIVLHFYNIFPNVQYTPLFIFTGLLVTLSIFQVLFSKFHPYSHATKYVSFGCLEFLIAFLATRDGLSLYISYVFISFLSCLYYNKRFTRNVNIFGWVVMIITFYFRSKLIIPEPVDKLTGWAWFAAYACGSTIEYFCCAVASYYITRTARETLDKQHEQDQRIQEMQTQLITGFANLVESKDITTGEHVKRTSYYVRIICYKLRDLGYYQTELTTKNIEYMVEAAPLHDLGKMDISEQILSKPGKLSPEEYDIIKEHPLYGARLIEKNLSNLEDEQYTEIAKVMALSHHEWWNGQGYPLHLIGKEIPLAARIMAAADVLDALLSIRPYKNAYPLDETLAIMHHLAGTQFDPAVVEAVELLRDDIRAYLEQQ